MRLIDLLTDCFPGGQVRVDVENLQRQLATFQLSGGSQTPLTISHLDISDWDEAIADAVASAAAFSPGTGISIDSNTISIDTGYVGQTSITTLGTITTGTWNGTTIAVANGGTGTTTSTGTGSVVLHTSPTFATSIATPSVVGVSGSLVLNATTALVVTGGGTVGLGAGNFTAAAGNLAVTAAGAGTMTGTWHITDTTANALLVAGGAKFAAQTTTIHPSTGLVTSAAGFSGPGSGLTGLDAGNFGAGTLAVARGGTGQASYTDGQLLIGNTSGNTLTKATLTGTASRLSVTNGNGSITLNIDTGYVGQASITTLGTIGTGVWQGTAVAVLYGGTGSTTAAGARTNLGATTKYSTTITGDGTTTAFVITHNLGTTDVVVQVKDSSGNVVQCEIQTTSTATCTITYFTLANAATLRVNVIG